MTLNIDRLRKQAKRLRKLFLSGDPDAVRRVEAVFPDKTLSNHTSALHVIAREQGHESWPKLKLASELDAMDRRQKVERLELALFNGQHWVVEKLLTGQPDLANAHFGLQCALYDIEAVTRKLSDDAAAACVAVGVRTPVLHLAFSRHFETAGADAGGMIAVAEALVAAGADVNDGYPAEPGSEHKLSALYGALGHAGNLQLAEWLLEHGASPDDGESLYHATELQSLDGLRLLMRHGVRVEGTNALPRMLDFNNLDGVKLLLDYGADPNEGISAHASGQPSMVVPALHQAARRNCSGQIVELLVEHGADGRTPYQGHSAYALARMCGNHAAADVIARAGQATELDANEDLLARAADGPVSGQLDPATLSDESRRIVGRLLGFARPASLDHIRRLVEIGIDPDWTDEMGLPAIQIAGWAGQADVVEWLLTFNPDLNHRNGFGGDLLGTILHGSEFNPYRQDRNHLRCAELVLGCGAPLSRKVIEHTGTEEMAAMLEQWAELHPEQLTD
jgi:hypothetical protein